MKNKKHSRMYCHPEFKKQIRKQAIESDKNVIEFTKDLIIRKKKQRGEIIKNDWFF